MSFLAREKALEQTFGTFLGLNSPIAAEIAGISGVDVLFVGPLDLSFALGVPRDFKSEKFIEATNKVLDAAKKNNKVAGILAGDIETAAAHRDRGFKFIGIGSDSTLLAGAISNVISQLKK